MNILNPNKYIRTGIINVLSVVLAPMDIWYKKVPVSQNNPTPLIYVVLDSQTKNETVVSKSVTEKATNFEWQCTIDVNIYSVNHRGFSNAEIVDDIEQKVLSALRSGFAIPNFDTKDVRILESLDLSVETNENSIDRKLIKFDIWLNYVASA